MTTPVCPSCGGARDKPQQLGSTDEGMASYICPDWFHGSEAYSKTPEIERIKTNPAPPSAGEGELRQQLAAIEHERWADWQRYCHSKLTETLNGMMMEWPDYKHWERQIDTTYADLTPEEQASDMEQVERYWPLINAYIARRVLEELDRGLVLSTPLSASQDYLDGFHSALDQVEAAKAQRIAVIKKEAGE
jgi:hypothetical protein